MKLWLAAAVPLETALLRERLGLRPAGPGRWQGRAGAWDAELLHTGIGMAQAAFSLGLACAGERPALAVQFGIAGSYREDLPPGAVAEVVSECFGDLGADSPEGLLDLEAMGFPLFELDGVPQYNRLHNPRRSALGLPLAAGLTVNTVTGTEAQREARLRRWQPDVETMEGGAFFLACLRSGIPFLELRGISNRAETRNRAAWKLREAAEAVQETVAAGLLGGGI